MKAAHKRLEDTGEVEVEYRQRTEKGNYKWLSTVCLLRKCLGQAAIRDGNLSDITVRKLAEEELRESREKLRTAFSSLTEAIFIADEKGALTDFNDEFVR